MTNIECRNRMRLALDMSKQTGANTSTPEIIGDVMALHRLAKRLHRIDERASNGELTYAKRDALTASIIHGIGAIVGRYSKVHAIHQGDPRGMSIELTILQGPLTRIYHLG